MAEQNADRLLAEWALNRFKMPTGSRFVSVTFGTFVDCYSSWTCDYGVRGLFKFTLPSGSTVEYPSEYGFPAAIQAMAEYRAARELVADEHSAYHGWDKEA